MCVWGGGILHIYLVASKSCVNSFGRIDVDDP